MRLDAARACGAEAVQPRPQVPMRAAHWGRPGPPALQRGKAQQGEMPQEGPAGPRGRHSGLSPAPRVLRFSFSLHDDGTLDCAVKQEKREGENLPASTYGVCSLGVESLHRQLAPGVPFKPALTELGGIAPEVIKLHFITVSEMTACIRNLQEINPCSLDLYLSVRDF